MKVTVIHDKDGKLIVMPSPKRAKREDIQKTLACALHMSIQVDNPGLTPGEVNERGAEMLQNVTSILERQEG